MRTEFKLTKKSNVLTLKILKSFLMVMAGFLILALLKNYPAEFRYLVLLSGLMGIMLLYALKSFRVIGKITFEQEKISIDTDNQKVDLPFHAIGRIKFILRGRKRTSYRPVIYQPIGVNVGNGTGNFIEIETGDTNYKFDIFLKDSIDEDSLEFQIKRLIDLGLSVEKRKMPVILADSI
jgi:hypothetical protein